MAGDELRKKYGKCVCCQMVCPPWDCEETVLPHQMDDEVAFVAKPNKFLLCCLPIPFPGIGVCCIAPWLSIDVHSVDANGHLKVTQHSMCGDSYEEYDDIVHVNSLNTYVSSEGIPKRELARMMSRTTEVQAKKEAINEFLKEKREKTGISLENPIQTQRIEMSSMAAQQPQHSQAYPAVASHPSYHQPSPQDTMVSLPERHIQRECVSELQPQAMAQRHHSAYPPPNMQPSYGGYLHQQCPPTGLGQRWSPHEAQGDTSYSTGHRV
eukprot:gb/GECG01011767.1/.p1 GENE.gb/GECG01011767.1/~~gb/GECG01011767.1/.p1  ORF type:complete len:267 (+),score=32.78 gb/GECG01011767.1/:1-801(+)